MKDLLEFVLEFALEGLMGTAESRRAPLALCIGLAALLILFFGGIVGLLLWVGIDTRNWPLVTLGAVLGILCAFWLGYRIRQFRRR